MTLFSKSNCTNIINSKFNPNYPPYWLIRTLAIILMDSNKSISCLHICIFIGSESGINCEMHKHIRIHLSPEFGLNDHSFSFSPSSLCRAAEFHLILPTVYDFNNLEQCNNGYPIVPEEHCGTRA